MASASTYLVRVFFAWFWCFIRWLCLLKKLTFEIKLIMFLLDTQMNGNINKSRNKIKI
ncbi:hypothetical protein Hanom_Chr13g01196931 [Helianthus anomalus]